MRYGMISLESLGMLTALVEAAANSPENKARKQAEIVERDKYAQFVEETSVMTRQRRRAAERAARKGKQ